MTLSGRSTLLIPRYKKLGLFNACFRGLAVFGLLEIIGLLYQLLAHPYVPGIAGQHFLLRIWFGLFISPGAWLMGILILRRAPGNVVGRFLILFAIIGVSIQFNYNLGTPRLTALAQELLILYGGGIVIPGFIYLMLTFPTGQVYPPRLVRWVTMGWIIKLTGALLEIMASPKEIKMLTLPMNPLLVTALAPYRSWIALTIGLTGLLLPLGLGVGLTSLALRYRAAPAREKQQIKWVIWALAILMLTLGANILNLLSHPVNALRINLGLVSASIAMLVFLAALVLAILRHHLFDIDLIINRTVVYGALTAIVISLYVLVVGTFGMLFQSNRNWLVSLGATGLIAVLFHPLRERVQRSVNRWMYGERDEPYVVLSRLGQRLEATLAPNAVLPTIAATVAQTLKLPYAAVAVKEGETFPIVAAWGKQPSATERAATEHLVRLPLVYQTETLGQLLVGRRAVGEAFTPTEQRLLADIAHQAGVAVHAMRLTADLQRSRERLVTSREDERRRIRRDLHDGLGPTLASMKLKLDALHYLLAPAQAEANGIVTELETDIQAALTDIRRLVDDLRPPALDQLGLISALQEYAMGLSARGLQVTVEGPSPLPALPAAVEVATYRIVLEALTNSVRHAQARVCRIRILLEAAPFTLRLEISDDGVGLPAHVQAGVGLTSMRERAAELGGTCTITPAVGGGTQVCPRLPCPQRKERRHGDDTHLDCR